VTEMRHAMERRATSLKARSQDALSTETTGVGWKENIARLFVLGFFGNETFRYRAPVPGEAASARNGFYAPDASVM
jgi:hypothetical protein